MYSYYYKFEKILAKIEMLCIVIPFVIIFATVVLQVFQRYFNLPVEDTSELSMTSMTIFSFMSMGYLLFTDAHITIEVHKLIKNYKILAVVEVIMYLLLIAFSVLYLYLSWDLFSFALSSGSSTTQMRIPLVIPYGALLLGFVCMIIHAVGKLLERWTYRQELEKIYEKEVNIEDMR